MEGEKKLNNVNDALACDIASGNWESVFQNLTEKVPSERLSLLWEILVEADLNDLESMEEKIYLYGKCLCNKDQFGRLLFARMALVLHNAQKVTA